MSRDSKLQQLYDTIAALELLSKTSKEAAEIYNQVLNGESMNAPGVGGLSQFLENLQKQHEQGGSSRKEAESAASALLIQLRGELKNASSHARDTHAVDIDTIDITDAVDSVISGVRNTIEGSWETMSQAFARAMSIVREQTGRAVRKKGIPQQAAVSTPKMLTAQELEQAQNAYRITTPATVNLPANLLKIRARPVDRPQNNAKIKDIISYLEDSGFLGNPEDLTDESKALAAEFVELVKEFRNPATTGSRKGQLTTAIRSIYKKVNRRSGNFSTNQIASIQQDIINPIIQALEAAGHEDADLNAASLSTASGSDVQRGLEKAIALFVEDQGAYTTRVGEAVMRGRMLQVFNPHTLSRIIKNVGRIVKRSVARPVVPRSETADLDMMNVIEGALGDTRALTASASAEYDKPDQPETLTTRTVFPGVVTATAAHFAKWRQSLIASLNSRRRYGGEAQGVDVRSGSQVVASSASAAFGNGFDALVQKAVDKLLARVQTDIQNGATKAVQVSGTTQILPETLANMVVEAIQASSVFSEHTTALGRMAATRGPRGALETGNPVNRMVALFAGDLISQYTATGGIGNDSAARFVSETVAPPEETAVTMATTHAKRLLERLRFLRDRATLDMVTAQPSMINVYQRQSVELTKQMQLLEELMMESTDPEEEKKLAARRGAIVLPGEQNPVSLTRDQALTVLLRVGIGSIPEAPDAVAPIMKKAQQISQGLSYAGLTLPIRPSYGTTPVQSLVDFFATGQSKSIEKFQTIPVSQQLDQIDSRYPGAEQRDIIEVISDNFGLSRQSASQGNAITGIYYGARAVDDKGRLRTGDDLDMALGGGYKTKKGIMAIAQAGAEMGSYASSGLPILDYARLETAPHRTQEEEAMLEDLRLKLPHLAAIGPDQLKALAGLDPSIMTPDALMKTVMRHAAPAIRQVLLDRVDRMAVSAGITDPAERAKLVARGTGQKLDPQADKGFQEIFRVINMFDPVHLASADPTTDINKAFGLFSQTVSGLAMPNEPIAQVAARLLGRENRLEAVADPVAAAVNETSASYQLMSAGGEVANAESGAVVGNLYGRTITNRENINKTIQEIADIEAEIEALRQKIRLNPGESIKLQVALDDRLDALKKEKQKLQTYRAAEPDLISQKFEALSTIATMDSIPQEQRESAIRELNLMQTIFEHTGRYVIDESQGYGSGTQEQRLAALLKHKAAVQQVEQLKSGEKSTTMSPAEIDALIGQTKAEIEEWKSPADALTEHLVKNGESGRDYSWADLFGETAGKKYTHPNPDPDKDSEGPAYISRRSTIGITSDYPQRMAEEFAMTGRIDIAPSAKGSLAAAVKNATVAQILGLPFRTGMPEVPTVDPEGVPSTGDSNPGSAGVVPYFFLPGQTEPMVVVGQSKGAFKGRGAPAPVMGTVDPGQTQWQAAEREAQEELGVVFDPKADVPVTVVPSTQDAFYMRRVQSISPADVHFETQAVQILPLSAAIHQIRSARTGTERDMMAGRQALEALQVMVEQGVIVNDQPDAPVPNSRVQKMQELTARLEALQRIKQSVEEGESTAGYAEELIQAAEEKIEALEGVTGWNDHAVALHKIINGARTRARKITELKHSKRDAIPAKAPGYYLGYTQTQPGEQEHVLPVFDELFQQYAESAPSKADYIIIDRQLKELDRELKTEDDIKMQKQKRKEEVQTAGSRSFNTEGAEEDIQLLVAALGGIGVNVETDEVNADSFLSGIGTTMQVVDALKSLAPEGDMVNIPDLTEMVRSIASNPDKQKELVQRVQEIAYDPETDLSEKAKQRLRLRVKKQLMPLFDPNKRDSSQYADNTNYQFQIGAIEEAQRQHREYTQNKAEADRIDSEIADINAQNLQDVQVLQDMEIPIESSDTDSIITAASGRLGAMIMGLYSGKAGIDEQMTTADLRGARNDQAHHLPGYYQKLSMYGQGNNTQTRLGFEAARHQQEMDLFPPVVVPTTEAILQNPDELLLDSDGKPILMFRGEDADQTAARLGEAPLIFEKGTVHDLNNPDDKPDELVYPTESPPAMGGGVRYGEGLYHGVTRASDDPLLAMDAEAAKRVALSYRGTLNAEDQMPQAVYMSALRSTAKLLDITPELEQRGLEDRDARRASLGLDTSTISYDFLDSAVELLYRTTVEPDARLRGEISDELEALLKPYNVIPRDVTRQSFEGENVPEDVIEKALDLQHEIDYAPLTATLAVAMGYDAMRFSAKQHAGEAYMTLFNPGATVTAAEPITSKGDTSYPAVTNREITAVSQLEQETAQSKLEIEKQKQKIKALKDLPENPADLLQRDAAIAEAEKVLQELEATRQALIAASEGVDAADADVYFTVDSSGTSVSPDVKTVIDKTVLKNLIRTRMTAPEEGETQYVTNSNVEQLVLAAESVTPAMLEEVLATTSLEDLAAEKGPELRYTSTEQSAMENIQQNARVQRHRSVTAYEMPYLYSLPERTDENKDLYDQIVKDRKAVEDFVKTATPEQSAKFSQFQKLHADYTRAAEELDAENEKESPDAERVAMLEKLMDDLDTVTTDMITQNSGPLADAMKSLWNSAIDAEGLDTSRSASLRSSVQAYYQTPSGDEKQKIIDSNPSVKAAIKVISDADNELSRLDAQRAATIQVAERRAEASMTPKQFVARLLKRTRQAMVDFADEFTSPLANSVEEVMRQLVSGVAAVDAADAPATDKAVDSELNRVLATFEEGFPALSGPGGTMSRRAVGYRELVSDIQTPKTANQLKNARRTVRQLGGRTDLSNNEQRRLAAARRTLHGHSVRKLVEKFPDNPGVIQLANILAGLTPPDWKQDPVQSHRVSMLSSMVGELSPMDLNQLIDKDLTNPVHLDMLSRNKAFAPIIDMLASQDTRTALQYKSGTQPYQNAVNVLDAIQSVRDSRIGASTTPADRKKLFFDLETNIVDMSKPELRQIMQAASGFEGEDIQQEYAIPRSDNIARIYQTVADTTMTEAEKRKKIRELALQQVGKRPMVEGTDVSSEVINSLVEHAMSGGIIYNQNQIKERLRQRIGESSAVVGHNIGKFDLPTVYGGFAGVPTDVAKKTEDTLLMSRALYPGGHTLSDTYKFMTGLDLVGAHDAATDTEAVRTIYPDLLDPAERKRAVERFMADRGISPTSTVGGLISAPSLSEITDPAEKTKTFQELAAGYTFYRPLSEMQEFTRRATRSGGKLGIRNADPTVAAEQDWFKMDEKAKASLMKNMQSLFGDYIAATYGGATLETLDDAQLGQFIQHVTDTYITPNLAQAPGGSFDFMARLMGAKMGGSQSIGNYRRDRAIANFDRFPTLEDRVQHAKDLNMQYNPANSLETVDELMSDLTKGKSSMLSTAPKNPAFSGGAVPPGGTPPGGDVAVSGPTGPGGGGGYTTIHQATIQQLHAQSVEITVNGGSIQVDANFSKDAAAAMNKSLVYVQNKVTAADGTALAGVSGGGGGGGGSRLSSADRASLNILEATKNEVAGKLQYETNETNRDALRGLLPEASRRVISEIIAPKAQGIFSNAELSYMSFLPDPKEALTAYNEIAQSRLASAQAGLAAEQAKPETDPNREDNIDAYEKEIMQIEELINALRELNNVEQKVGMANSTRTLGAAGLPAATNPSVASRRGLAYDQQSALANLQLARNAFDQAGGTLPSIAGGATTANAREFLVDLTRQATTTLLKNADLKSPTMQANIAAVSTATGSTDVSDAYSKVSDELDVLSNASGTAGTSVSELANDLFTSGQALENLRMMLEPLATTSPEAAAALGQVQAALDQVQRAGSENKKTAGVIDADNRRKLQSVEEQMQAAVTRPGFFASGRRQKEATKIMTDYLEQTYGTAGAKMLMEAGRLKAYTSKGKRVAMELASDEDIRTTVQEMQKQGVSVSEEDLKNVQKVQGRVLQTQRQAPMGDKLFYAASKIRDVGTIAQLAIDTVANIPNIPRIVGGVIDQFASSATGSNRVLTTARGLALNPNNYAAALNAADQQRKMFGGSLTSNLSQVSSFIPLSNAYGVDIGKTVKVARKLAAFDPAQGMEGASIAIKEFLSGNVSSLSRRFEINRSALSKINTGDANQMLDSLNQVLSSMGVTDRLIDEQANAMATKYDKMVGNLESIQISLSSTLVDLVTPALEALIGDQSYFGKNVKERSLNTVLKETITSYGEEAFSNPVTGLNSVNIGADTQTFVSQLDSVFELANRRMAAEAGNYNQATGALTQVAPYRMLGNMKPEEQAKIQFDAALFRAQGMTSSQAIMQAYKNNPGDYNAGQEYLLQRESLKGKPKIQDPQAYANAYAAADRGMRRTAVDADFYDNIQFTSLGGGQAVPNFNAKTSPAEKNSSRVTKGRILRQKDADTYLVEVPGMKEPVTARIAGIDTYEHGSRGDWEARVFSAKTLGMATGQRDPRTGRIIDRGMIGKTYAPGTGPEVTMLGDLNKKDIFGRSVVTMISRDGKNLALEMVASGNSLVSFSDSMDDATYQNLKYVEKIAAQNGVGSMNRVARDLQLGSMPAISQEVRDAYYWKKYGFGLSTQGAAGGALGAVAGAGVGLAGAATYANGILGTTGLVGLGGLTTAELALGIGGPAVAGLALGYGVGTHFYDKYDNSPEKMRELYKMQAEKNRQDQKLAAFTTFANEANNNITKPGQRYVGGAYFAAVRENNGRGIRRDGYTDLGYRQKIQQEGIAIAGADFVKNYDEAMAAGQERYAAADDANKKILGRTIINPLNNQQTTYTDYEAQVTALRKTAETDPTLYLEFAKKQNELIAPILQTAALQDNSKILEQGAKYGAVLDKRALAEAAAIPERQRIQELTKARDEADREGAFDAADEYQKQIDEATAKIDEMTYTDAEWEKVPEAVRNLVMNAETAATLTAEQIAYASAAISQQLANPTDYKREAKTFSDNAMDRMFQRRQQRVDTVLMANARQSLMGLGPVAREVEDKKGNKTIVVDGVGSMDGPMTGLSPFDTRSPVITTIDISPESMAVRELNNSGLMPENRQSGTDTVKELTEAQKAAVREQQDIIRTNRMMARATAPEMQLYQSGFSNFVMAMAGAGSSAEKLSQEFLNTMDMMSQGNARYGIEIAQQVTGLNYSNLIQMQFTPMLRQQDGSFVNQPGSTLLSPNGGQYSGTGAAMMPYTSGPRGTIQYTRDLFRPDATGVRQGLLGVAPGEFSQLAMNAANANAQLQRQALNNAIQERDMNKNHMRTLEDITRGGMRQLESIHLNYTRQMVQMTSQAELVKRMNRANMARSIAVADIYESDRTRISQIAYAGDQRAMHLGQGRSDLFLKDSNLEAIKNLDPSLAAGIDALAVADTAYQAVEYGGPNKENLQIEKNSKIGPVLDRLKELYKTTEDPATKAMLETAIRQLSPDASATIELSNINTEYVQQLLGDAITAKQLGTQAADIAYENGYRGLDALHNVKNLEEAGQSGDPLALLDAARSSNNMYRGWQKTDEALAGINRTLTGTVETAGMFADAYAEPVKTIEKYGSPTFQNFNNTVEDFSISFKQQMEDALRNFERERLDMIQSWADAAVEIASIIPEEIAPIVEAERLYLQQQRQADLLWMAGDTEGANDLSYKALLGLGTAVYGEEGAKAYANKYKSVYKDRPKGDDAGGGGKLPQGDISKTFVMANGGWAVRVVMDKEKKHTPEPNYQPINYSDNKRGGFKPDPAAGEPAPNTYIPPKSIDTNGDGIRDWP